MVVGLLFYEGYACFAGIVFAVQVAIFDGNVADPPCAFFIGLMLSQNKIKVIMDCDIILD